MKLKIAILFSFSVLLLTGQVRQQQTVKNSREGIARQYIRAQQPFRNYLNSDDLGWESAAEPGNTTFESVAGSSNVRVVTECLPAVSRTILVHMDIPPPSMA